MDKYTATEQAYKNGYEKGYEAGKKEAEDEILIVKQKRANIFEILDAYERGMANTLKWIPVSERLPELHTKVLCCGIRGGRFIAELTTWGNGNLIWDKRTGRGCPEVTHWMPLPEPPKEEKE